MKNWRFMRKLSVSLRCMIVRRLSLDAMLSYKKARLTSIYVRNVHTQKLNACTVKRNTWKNKSEIIWWTAIAPCRLASTAKANFWRKTSIYTLRLNVRKTISIAADVRRIIRESIKISMTVSATFKINRKLWVNKWPNY